MIVGRSVLVAFLVSAALWSWSASAAEYRSKEDLLLLLSLRRESDSYRNFLLTFRGLNEASKTYRTDPSVRERVIYSKNTGLEQSRQKISYKRYLADRGGELAAASWVDGDKIYDTASDVLPLPSLGRYLVPKVNALALLSKDSAAASPAEMIRQLDLAGKDPRLMAEVRKAFKTQFGIDLDSDLDKESDVALAKTRIATDILARDQNGLRAEISKQAAAIKELSADLRKVLDDLEQERITAAEAEARRKEIIRDGENAAAGLRLIGFVAEWTGNEKLAAFAFGAADRTTGLFDLLARQAEMSSFAFGVGMLYQVNGIVSLMKGASEPAEIEMLRALMSQIQALREEMAARFENLSEFIGSFWRNVDARFDKIEAILAANARLDEFNRAEVSTQFDAINAILGKAYAQQFVLADEARRNSEAALHLQVDVDRNSLLSIPYDKNALNQLNAKIVTLAQATGSTPFVAPPSVASDVTGASQSLGGSGNAFVPLGVYGAGASVFDERASQLLGTSATRLPFNIGAWLDFSRSYRGVARLLGERWMNDTSIANTDRLIAFGERARTFRDYLFPASTPSLFWPMAIGAFEIARNRFSDVMANEIAVMPGQFDQFDRSKPFADVEAREKAAPYASAGRKAGYCSDYGFFAKEPYKLSSADRLRWQKAEFPLPNGLEALLPWEVRLAERVMPRTHSIRWCINPSKLVWKPGSDTFGRAFLLYGTVESAIYDGAPPPTVNRLTVQKVTDIDQVEPGRLTVAVAVVPYAEEFALTGGNWEKKQAKIDAIWAKSIDGLDLKTAQLSAIDGYIDYFTKRTDPSLRPGGPGSIQQRGFDIRALGVQFAKRCVIADRTDLKSLEERVFCSDNRLAASSLFGAVVAEGKSLSMATAFEQEKYRADMLELLKGEYADERNRIFQSLQKLLVNPSFQQMGQEITLSATILRAACIYFFVDQCLQQKEVFDVLFGNGALQGYDSALATMGSANRLTESSIFATFDSDTDKAVTAATVATATLKTPGIPSPIEAELTLLRKVRASQRYWQRRER